MLRRRRPRAAVPAALSVFAPAVALALLCLVSVAGSAFAATVPLNGRSFDAACNASSPGDVVAVPAGSYGSQSLSCQKAVTFSLDPGAELSYLNFSGANGPTVAGGRITGSANGGAVQMYRSANVTLRGAHVHNLIYVEGTVNSTIDGNVIEPAPGGTSWSNGDMIDVYEQTRTPQPNTGLTISNNVLHGLRAPSASAHSDAIQFCNCGNPDQVPKDIKVLRNRFYDNECMNIRANERDELLIEQNMFGDTVTGISGCGAYALDVYYASATVRYNTFVGKQKIQVDRGADVGQSQSWVGNAGNGMSEACGAIRATYARNVWTQQKCGATDKQVSSLKIAADGTPVGGSPLIDAGDASQFPAQDFNGGNRFVGGGPDAGAVELGATTGAPVPPPAPNAGGPGTDGASTAPSGLVAAFGFDEKSGAKVLDASGNGLDGVRRGASRVASGRFGRALSFDGRDDRVTVPDSEKLRLRAGVTLEAWVRPTARGRSRLVLSRGGGKAGMSYGLYASDSRAPAGTVRTVANASRAARGAVQRARGKARLPLRRWSHVAVTFNGTFVRIYVDGEWVTSRKAPGSLIDAAGALRIGGGASRATSFRGRIDEVRVYDHALTGAEIQSDLARPVGG